MLCGASQQPADSRRRRSYWRQVILTATDDTDDSIRNVDDKTKKHSPGLTSSRTGRRVHNFSFDGHALTPPAIFSNTISTDRSRQWKRQEQLRRPHTIYGSPRRIHIPLPTHSYSKREVSWQSLGWWRIQYWYDTVPLFLSCICGKDDGNVGETRKTIVALRIKNLK